MRKKWFKKIGAAICAAVLTISGMNLTAFAAGEKIEVFGDAEYQNLAGLTGGETTGTINVEKKISPVDASKVKEWNTQLPVKGAEMAVIKVGQYATVTETNGTVKTMIGIDKDLVEAVLSSETSKMILDSGYYYMPYDLYDDFQNAMKTAGNNLNNDEAVKSLIATATKKNTEDNGVASFTNCPFGIYLVAENSVTTAQIDKDKDGTWENVLFSKKQYPYIVSLPFSESGTWTTTVNAKAKNEESPVDVDKMIERDSNTLTGKRDHQFKTDVTHVGDTVEFTLITDVPMIESHEGVQSYVITDEISAGYTLPGTFTAEDIKITDSQDQSYTFGTDYTVAWVNGATDPSKYAKTVTIEFTPSGRKLIEKPAHVSDGGQEIYVSYIVKVNENAIVGTAGNPNRVKLKLAAAGSGEIATDWKDVTEFIFTMEGTKTFDGNQDNDNAADVKFKLYLDEDCTKAVVLTGDNGAYTYNGTSTPGEATEISLSDTSTFSVKGVPVTNENEGQSVTLYLKETATADGYNKLAKVIPITLTANQDVNEVYDGRLLEGKVNEVNATLNVNKDGITFTVNNTSGFQLPSTGGMGIWMFVVGGILVIAFGIFYYRRSKKSA